MSKTGKPAQQPFQLGTRTAFFALLQSEGNHLWSDDVFIIDPCMGTGNFIVSLPNKACGPGRSATVTFRFAAPSARAMKGTYGEGKKA